MEIDYICSNPPTGGLGPPGTHPSVAVMESFECVLEGEQVYTTDDGSPHALDHASSSPPYPFEAAPNTPSRANAVAAYQKQEVVHRAQSDWEKYKDDQLLRNPGGDHYDLENRLVDANPNVNESFWDRIGKDFSDVLGNMTNFVGNLFFGADTHYRGENDGIRMEKGKGVLSSIVDFFEDWATLLVLASGGRTDKRNLRVFWDGPGSVCPR